LTQPHFENFKNSTEARLS